MLRHIPGSHLSSFGRFSSNDALIDFLHNRVSRRICRSKKIFERSFGSNKTRMKTRLYIRSGLDFLNFGHKKHSLPRNVYDFINLL